jgi:hypothetical protein
VCVRGVRGFAVQVSVSLFHDVQIAHTHFEPSLRLHQIRRSIQTHTRCANLSIKALNPIIGLWQGLFCY